MHQRAARRRRGRRLGDPVDHPEPVEQRARHEVGGARRRQRRRRIARRAEVGRVRHVSRSGHPDRGRHVDGEADGRIRHVRWVHSATVGQGTDIPQPTRRGRAQGRTKAAPKAAQPPGPLAIPPDARSIGAVASGQEGQQDQRGQADQNGQGGGLERPAGSARPGGPGEPGRHRGGAPVRHPRVRVAVLVRHRGRLHRHLRQRPEQLAARQHQVRGRGRLRGAAVPVRAGARTGPLGRRPRLTACRCAASCCTPSAASPRSTRSRRPRSASFCVSAAGPALSLALGAVGWALLARGHPRGRAARWSGS